MITDWTLWVRLPSAFGVITHMVTRTWAAVGGLKANPVIYST